MSQGELAPLEFLRCAICGEDFASLLHFGWSDKRAIAHDFEAEEMPF